jgi:hypothetical protein
MPWCNSTSHIHHSTYTTSHLHFMCNHTLYALIVYINWPVKAIPIGKQYVTTYIYTDLTVEQNKELYPRQGKQFWYTASERYVTALQLWTVRWLQPVCVCVCVRAPGWAFKTTNSSREEGSACTRFAECFLIVPRMVPECSLNHKTPTCFAQLLSFSSPPMLKCLSRFCHASVTLLGLFRRKTFRDPHTTSHKFRTNRVLQMRREAPFFPTQKTHHSSLIDLNPNRTDRRGLLAKMKSIL